MKLLDIREEAELDIIEVAMLFGVLHLHRHRDAWKRRR